MSVISQNMIDALGKQYRHETLNSLRYYQRATYAEMLGLSGIAGFFKSQGDGERNHADKVYKYVNDRNVMVSMNGLSFMEPDFTMGHDVINLFETAMQVENDTTALLEGILSLAYDERDYLTVQWLVDSEGLLREQAEEENIIRSILDHIGQMRSSPSLIHDLETMLGSKA